MKQADFVTLVEHIRKETTDLLIAKGREYAGDEDRLANFKRGAAQTGTEPLTVLFIYLSKHYDALATFVKDTQSGGPMPVLSEPITGRLADIINYCILAWALIEESKGPAQEVVKEFAFGSPVASAFAPRSPRLRLYFVDASHPPVILATWAAVRDFLGHLELRAAGSKEPILHNGRQVSTWQYIPSSEADPT